MRYRTIVSCVVSNSIGHAHPGYPASRISTPVKTTIELPGDLLQRSKAVARRENSSLEALIVWGTCARARLRERPRARKRAAPFVVQPFQSEGLTPQFAASGWEKVGDEIHRDRG